MCEDLDITLKPLSQVPLTLLSYYNTFIWVSVSKPHLIMLIRFDLQLAYFGKHGRGVHFSAFIKPGKTDHVQ